ncbi:hypothetical protein CBU02nite_16740 [Clostridium butyricum]|uniref:DUF6431 domain-containing protein n=1 Tax=Clostridium butyricum TaxID=1492 RepID=A0A512TME2_CLOBU|nr:hypothetical protein CBU02nite_16740 [Clostridium butyricum]
MINLNIEKEEGLNQYSFFLIHDYIQILYIMIIDNIPNFIQRIIKNSEDDFYVPVHGCNRCGYVGNLHRHASYYRNVICEDVTARVKIQRVICPSCNKTHAILHAELIPYYQHTLTTILKLIKLIKIKQKTYSEVIKSFRNINPCLCEAHINFYLLRFNYNYNRVLYYFRTIMNYIPNPPNCGAAVILDNLTCALI